MVVSYWKQKSPLGPLFVYQTLKGVCAIEFQDRVARRKSKKSTDLKISKQLNEYFLGKRKTFTIPIDLCLTHGFTRKALKTLQRQVRYGEKISYGELASKIGKPSAARAIGQAMRKNPIPIVIPCHRVVASDGSLGGYSAGLHRKKRLLTIEKTAV